jgi:predicted DsbA family dithiol-disulfide isomerase
MTTVTAAGRIDVISDAICPWCYIGKRHLERALDILEQHKLRFTVAWHPFQLNPDMPAEGVDRKWTRASPRSPRASASSSISTRSPARPTR